MFRMRLALVFLFTAAILVGCDRSQSDRAGAPVDLRFWNGFTGPDGRTMLAIVKRFNEQNRDVHVTMQRMDWGTFYNKLFVAGLGGRAPEVFVIQTDSLARFTQANFVRPMDDLTGAGGIDAGDFDENVWKAVEHNGKHYGIPLDIHLLGMYYNRKLFRDAGIVDASGNPAPPTNREEFVAALKKFRREQTWGFVYTWQRTNIYAMIRQNGGDIFNASHTAVTLNSPQNVEALQWCADLILKEHLVPPPQDFDAWIGFRQGKVAMTFEGIYMLPDLMRQEDLDYGAAPIPRLFKQDAAWCNSHDLCLRADLAGAELAAAKRFVKYLSDNSLDWAAGGQIPVRKSLRASVRFQQMTAQREFAKEIPYAAYMPATPYILEYMAEYELAIERALHGTMSAEQALNIAARNIEKIMQRYHAAEKAR
jgi:multiple sugar transport system substrate-binding protein